MSVPVHTDPPTNTDAERLGQLLARPVITVAEALELVPVSRATIARAMDAGDLPRHKIGRKVLLATPDVLAWAGAA